MEIPDIIVVNKADHPLTDTMVREIRGVLSLAPQKRLARADRQDRGRPGRGRRRAGGEDRRAPRAHRGGGDAVRAPPPQPAQRGRRARAGACAASSRPTSPEDAEFQRLLDEVVARRLDPASAAREILERETAPPDPADG